MILRFVLVRLLRAIPILLVGSLVAFLLADPGEPSGSSWPERYADFMFGIVRGEVSADPARGPPVGELLAWHAGASLSLAAVAAGLALVVGVPAGVALALHPSRHLGQVAAALGGAMGGLPASLLAVAVLLLVGVRSEAGGPGLLWPAIALGLGQSGLVARALHDGLATLLERGFVRFALARGMPETELARQIGANLIVLLAPGLASQAGAFAVSLAAVEVAFGWPGLGLLLSRALTTLDAPVLAGWLLLAVGYMLLARLAAALLAFALDPRTRAGRSA